MHFLQSFRQHRLLGGAMVLALTQFGASFVGLVRDRMMASTFEGSLHVVDTYLAAFRPADFLFQVFIMSAVGTVLVPMLAAKKVKNDEVETGRLLGAAMGTGGLVFAAIAIIMTLAFPCIAPYFVQFEGKQLELYITFARIIFLSDLLMVLGNVAGQYLVTVQRFWVYGLTPIIYSLGTIVGTVFLTPIYGPYGPIIGTVAGAVLYALWRIGAVLYSGLRFRFRWWHQDLSEMGILMLPRMLALGAMQLQLLFFDSIASGMDSGSITVNAYARNFQSVVVGVAGIAVAQSAYALLSQAAAKKEGHRFWIYLRKGISLLLVVTIPGAIALSLLAPIAARLIHLTDVLRVFSLCLLLYAVSIPFESINHLLLRSFYALKNTLAPAIMMVSGGFIAILAAWVLAPQYGIYSLAIGFTLGQIVQMIGLGLLLPQRVRNLTE